MFSFVYLISPIALPPMGVSKKIGGIADILAILVHHLDYFLTIIGLIVLMSFFYKIYKNLYKSYLKKIEILLYRLYSEILLMDKVKNRTISASEKESIDLILHRINKWLFIRKVGKHNQERMVDALNFIKAGKLDPESSLKLVTNWVKMVNYLITNF